MNTLTAIVAAIGNFIYAHKLLCYMIYSTAVGTLRSPTAQSSQFYVTLFAVANALAVNFGRMFPKVENSPNFLPAVEKHCDALNGGAK